MFLKDFFIKYHLRAYWNLFIFYAPYLFFLILFLVLFCLSVLYDKPREIEPRANSISSLEIISLKGVITSIKAAGHGQQRIRVTDKITCKQFIYDLQGNFPFEEYQIKAGDSISKDANSKIIILYRYNEKGIYEKGFVYDLSPWLVKH